MEDGRGDRMNEDQEWIWLTLLKDIFAWLKYGD